MNDWNLPDAPDIKNTLETGYPNIWKTKVRYCPVCDTECETIYVSEYEGAIGCENCITSYEAWEYFEN